MNAPWHSLAEHGGMLLCGTTLLLGLGCLAMWLERSPIHRRRAGELAVLGVLVWLVLALVPMPRLSPDFWRPSEAGDATAGAVAPYEPLPEVSADSWRTIPQARLDDLESVLTVPPAPASVASGREQDVPAPAESLLAPAPGEPEDVDSPETRSWSAAMVWPTVTDRLSSADFGRWMAAGYLAGSLACAGWLVLGRVLLARMQWSARPPEAWVSQLCQEMGLRRRRAPRVLVSSRTARALCFGLWRPTIVLPEAACRPEHRDALRHVLRHEMAHLRQGDAWGQVLFNLALPLLYVHPLYWWVRVRANLAAELVADDQAASASVKESYVDALIGLARQCGGPRRVCWSSHGMSSSPSQFYRRMQMLLSRDNRLAWQCSWRWRLIYPAACILVVALLGCTLGVRPLPAQEPDAVQRLERQVAELKSQLDALRSEDESLRKDRAGLQQEIGSLQQRLTKKGRDDPTADRPAAKAVAETARQKSVRVYRLSVKTAAELDRLVKALKGVTPSVRIESDARFGALIVSAEVAEHSAIGELLGLLEESGQRRAGPEDRRQGTSAPDRTGPEQPEAKGGGDGKPRSASMESRRTESPHEAQRFATEVLALRKTATGELDPMLGALNRLAPSVRIEQPAGTDTLVVTGDRAQVQAFLDALGAMREAQKRAEQAGASAERGRTDAVQSGPARFGPSALPSADPALARGESAPLDLVGLANSCLDAVEKLSVAQLEFAAEQNLDKQQGTSRHATALAEVRLKAAARRLESLRGLAEDALVAAKDEYSTLHPLFEARQKVGTSDPDHQIALKIQLQRAESRLRMLERILGTCALPEPKDPAATPKAAAGKR